MTDNHCLNFSSKRNELFTGDYMWLIEKFTEQPRVLESPVFTVGTKGEIKLKLHLFQTIIDGEPWYHACICVHEITSPLPKVDLVHRFSIETSKGKRYTLNQELTMYLSEGDFVGIKIVTRKFLIENSDVYLLNDNLKIHYEMILHKSRMKFKIPNSTILKDLEDLYESQKASDVKFIVDSKEFKAHKVILSARSSVFSTMFETKMKESQENEVRIEDVDAQAFGDLLRFIYTDQVDNLEENAFELLRAAHRYDLARLKVTCEEQLYRNLDADNCAAIFSAADIYNCRELKDRTLKYIIDNATIVMKTEGYKTMGKEHPHLMLEAFQALANKSSEK